MQINNIRLTSFKARTEGGALFPPGNPPMLIFTYDIITAYRIDNTDEWAADAFYKDCPGKF